MPTERQANRLLNETSPYLQQHAHNPVDWFPWSEEALEKAKKENKPILLSIGYAACHWCHVMAHESFEDEETAALMNQWFINIKVDREDRPDLDKTYQMAHYVLTRQGGGWPLTVFLTPDDLVPFFSGTYFPLNAQYGMPAFKTLLTTIADIYQNQFTEIKQQNLALTNLLQPQHELANTVTLTAEPIKEAYKQLEQNFDSHYGGFGTAPKFPQPVRLQFLLYLYPQSPMVMSTLNAMANGGIYDQLGGGFFRYSVDEAWQIPHFEKMLYDNGQLLTLYANAAAYYHENHFKQLSKQLSHRVITEMQSDEGGYYASVDADTEGKEGKYTVWDKSEIMALLSQKEYAVIERYYGLNQPPNFENHWHLSIATTLESIATDLTIPLPAVQEILQRAQATLLNARYQRPRPQIDKKILTAWNGLMIKGMYNASMLLDDASLSASADKALAHLKTKLWDGKQLYVSYKDGKVAHPGFLDDYVFFIDALFSALQLKWESDDLNLAIKLTDTLLEKFEDQAVGGFFFTEKTDEQLIYRPKTYLDEAIPAGNGIAALVLLLLSTLTGEDRFLKAAERTLQVARKYLYQFPAEHCSLVLALQAFLNPPEIIIIRGDNNEECRQWAEQVRKITNHVFVIPNDAIQLPPLLSAMTAKNKTCAYVCEGHHCSGAINNLNSLLTI